MEEVADRKNSVVRFVDRFGDRDLDRAEWRYCSNRAFTVELASRERFVRLPHLYLANDLARESRADLSTPGSIADLGNDHRRCGPRFDYSCGFCSPTTRAIFNHRLVLVCADALAGDRTDSSGEPGARGSLQLLATDRTLRRCDVGDGRSHTAVSVAP